MNLSFGIVFARGRGFGDSARERSSDRLHCGLPHSLHPSAPPSGHLGRGRCPPKEQRNKTARPCPTSVDARRPEVAISYGRLNAQQNRTHVQLLRKAPTVTNAVSLSASRSASVWNIRILSTAESQIIRTPMRLEIMRIPKWPAAPSVKRRPFDVASQA